MAMDVEKLYTRVEDALKRKNYDFAIEILKNQILKSNPNDVKARKLLRGTVLQKYKSTSFPGKGQVLSKGLAPLIKMLIGKMTKKWDTVIDEAENYLLYDPKNISVLYKLGEACIQAQYTDTAIAAFEDIMQVNPSYVPAMKALGRVYEQKEDLEKAQQHYQKATRLAPNDVELAKLLKNISATITSKQYGSASSSQDLIKDKDKAKKLQEDQQMIRTEEDRRRAIERSKAELEKDPNNKKELRKLGEHYQHLGELDEAIATYEKVVQLDPTSFDVKCRIGECRIKKADSMIERWQEKLKQNPNDEKAKQELAKAKKIKLETEIVEYDIQVKGQPTNFDLRFKLGIALFNGGRFDEAISEFQTAVKDPKKKLQASRYMGQAFVQKKEYDLAIEQFQGALKTISDKDSQYKDVLYDLGIAYEAAKKITEAVETYTRIYKEDLKFRDVQERLKRLKK